MKKNNKGFMLVEVIIVTVVVASIMTSLFVVFNRVYNAYDKKSKYVDVDAIYALKLLEDYMIDNELMLNDLIINNTNYTKIVCDEIDNDNFATYCNSVFGEYNINDMYLVNNSEEALNSLKDSDVNQTFKEYIEYLINIGVHNEEASKIFVVETYSINDASGEEKNILNKYAYLPVKTK